MCSTGYVPRATVDPVVYAELPINLSCYRPLKNINPGLSKRFKIVDAFKFEDFDDVASLLILVLTPEPEGARSRRNNCSQKKSQWHSLIAPEPFHTLAMQVMSKTSSRKPKFVV
ncbi:hypothetical protein BDZ97DRAFT_1846275 [Flammula alnicola]|nr:hypothetical protein BDZ97DRAFT_1846275 [Flammula alnicola]